jgi:hypothetical protein
VLSSILPSKDKLILALRTLRDSPVRVPILFALAAFLVGYGCSAYAVRVSDLFAHRGEGIYCVQNCQGSYDAWYRHNQEAANHTDVLRQLVVLSFPAAMTLAIIFAMSLGWLPNIRIRRLVPALGLIYCCSVAAALLAMLSLTFSLSLITLPLGIVFGLLAGAVYPYSLVSARAVLAEKDPDPRSGDNGSIFVVLFLSGPFGLVIGAALHQVFPTFILSYGVHVALGATFGASLASASPQVSPQPPSIRPRVLTTQRATIERLALALGAQIVVSAITMFQHVSRPLLPGQSIPDLVAPFILTQLPFVILICVLLTQPGRRAFTFLTAMLAFGLIETFFNPTVVLSYRQIYLDHPIGLMWPAFSGLIYIVTGVLAYMVIQKTGFRPRLWAATLSTLGMFCYFILIEQVTPHLNNLWQ